jgi:hypothetical protein
MGAGANPAKASPGNRSPASTVCQYLIFVAKLVDIASSLSIFPKSKMTEYSEQQSCDVVGNNNVVGVSNQLRDFEPWRVKEREDMSLGMPMDSYIPIYISVSHTLCSDVVGSSLYKRKMTKYSEQQSGDVVGDNPSVVGRDNPIGGNNNITRENLVVVGDNNVVGVFNQLRDSGHAFVLVNGELWCVNGRRCEPSPLITDALDASIRKCAQLGQDSPARNAAHLDSESDVPAE